MYNLSILFGLGGGTVFVIGNYLSNILQELKTIKATLKDIEQNMEA